MKREKFLNGCRSRAGRSKLHQLRQGPGSAGALPAVAPRDTLPNAGTHMDTAEHREKGRLNGNGRAITD